MTKFKASLWLLFFLLVSTPIGYIGYLNQSYFLQANSLSMVLEKPFIIDYSTPEITNIAYWVGCIVLTWLIISIVRLPKYFRTRKKIKLLEDQIDSQNLEIVALLESQKNATTERLSVENQTDYEERSSDNKAAVAT
jgi:hypothetical protein|tara:strand:- start:438 stop:848 length:411 start_codon:yes stop_codon:yes gene_type:complete